MLFRSGADSLDVVEVTMALDETFGIGEMEEEDISGISCVADLVRFISAKLED